MSGSSDHLLLAGCSTLHFLVERTRPAVEGFINGQIDAGPKSCHPLYDRVGLGARIYHLVAEHFVSCGIYRHRCIDCFSFFSIKFRRLYRGFNTGLRLGRPVRNVFYGSYGVI